MRQEWPRHCPRRPRTASFFDRFPESARSRSPHCCCCPAPISACTARIIRNAAPTSAVQSPGRRCLSIRCCRPRGLPLPACKSQCLPQSEYNPFFFFYSDYRAKMQKDRERVPQKPNIGRQREGGARGRKEAFLDSNNFSNEQLKQIKQAKMFGNFCQSQSCLGLLQKKYEVQVPSFFPVQQTINQLPAFEHFHYDPHPPSSIPRKSAYSHAHSEANTLKRVKSEPQQEMLNPPGNEKENGKERELTEYGFSPQIMKQQSADIPPIRILYDKHQNSTDSILRKDLLKSNARTNVSQNRAYWPPSHSAASNPHPPTLSEPPASHSSFISVQEYNRVVNINMNLIKMMEDYKPLKKTVSHLQEEQQERNRLIDMMEDRIKNLRTQMSGGRHSGAPRRFY